MILKLKMKDESKKNIEVIKSHFFDDSDKITAGYVIGMAVEQTNEISDSEWQRAVSSVLYENTSVGISTSISLRQEVFEKINKLKDKLQNLCGKSLYMSQVIDMILFAAANKLKLNVGLESLAVMQWNINAGSIFASVNLIADEVLEKSPHIFVFTKFLKSVGWSDLKAILEEKYHVYDSPYLPKENGICIGIKKECGIEYLGVVSKSSVFSPHLNAPDFYELHVRMNSKKVAVIGARIRIDSQKARSTREEIATEEQKQRFEQYKNLMDHLAQRLDDGMGVIVLGDFNNSRILPDYAGKASAEYNYQKIAAFAAEKTEGRLSVYTPKGDGSSVGAFWDSAAKAARAPMPKKERKHKYDHVLTNYSAENLAYNWGFLTSYDQTCFTAEGRICAGYPDHAMLLAEIKLE